MEYDNALQCLCCTKSEWKLWLLRVPVEFGSVVVFKVLLCVVGCFGAFAFILCFRGCALLFFFLTCSVGVGLF